MSDIDSFSITPSTVIEFLFCPRFIYFMNVLDIPQFEEYDFKVLLGRMVHTEKLNLNKDYLRKKINAKAKYTDVYMSNNFLRGKVDEVIELNDGTYAPLDYKFAEYKDTVYKALKYQIYCYAVLIEDNFNVKVNKGFLVFTRSNNKVIEVPVPPESKKLIYNSCKDILNIIETNVFPKVKVNKNKCSNCIYRNICVL
ncbi:MAG TPA: CRISPR-associated protein Cas4 [Melioribacteraceae bacterium]|nr:CRISPR-associated protein Cas4 [Melioribacteraceae bacterium]